MKEPSDARLNRLLTGRDKLSQADKDAVLEGVFARLPQEPSASPGPAFAPWLRWAFAATALLLFVSAGYFLFSPSTRSEFTSRGEARATRAFSIHCAQDMVEGRCARGGKLLFKVDPRGARWFAALARSESAAVVWYFEAVEIKDPSAGGLLEQGVPLGSEHAPGHWEVIGLFSERPLDKARIRALLEEGGAKDSAGIEIVRRPLEVLP